MRSPLVSADWLKSNLDVPNVRVLDATWVPPFLKERPNGTACYDAGHVPGAAYFNIDDIADQETSLKHMLPDADQFAAKVSALGISNDTHIIVYDSNGFFASARAWWMFRAMGHDAVQVLDGGLKSWKAAGGAVETSTPDPASGSFKAALKHALVRDKAEMHAHLDAKDTRILDARAQGRFDGTSPEPRPDLPSGHMPGSICVPVTNLLAPDGTMSPIDQLAPVLSDYLDTPVVTSCGSGVSAAVISLALAQLGNWDAALYDGSWSEWAANVENPIDRAT